MKAIKRMLQNRHANTVKACGNNTAVAGIGGDDFLWHAKMGKHPYI